MCCGFSFQIFFPSTFFSYLCVPHCLTFYRFEFQIKGVGRYCVAFPFFQMLLLLLYSNSGTIYHVLLLFYKVALCILDWRLSNFLTIAVYKIPYFTCFMFCIFRLLCIYLRFLRSNKNFKLSENHLILK